MKIGGRWHAERGQSVVEFALILPVLLLLTLGVVDGARVFTSWIALNSGVSEATLYATNTVALVRWCWDPSTAPAGSVACPPGTVGAPADAACGLVAGQPPGNWCGDPNNIAYRLRVEASGLDTSQIRLVDPICRNSGGGQVPCDSTAADVTVGATYRMTLLMPIVGSIMGSPIVMSASATAPIIPVTP